jgi:hypothetical protein
MNKVSKNKLGTLMADSSACENEWYNPITNPYNDPAMNAFASKY